MESRIAQEADHGAVQGVIEGFLVVLGAARVAVVLRVAFETILPAGAAALSNQLCIDRDSPLKTGPTRDIFADDDPPNGDS